MKKLTLFIAGLMLISCSNEEVILPPDLAGTNLKAANKGIVHHASIGSNDACASLGQEPGCDKSFSLVANMKADGSVKGQWVDKFGGDVGGIHVSIDCMSVDGNTAIVGGFVTKGSVNGVDLEGSYAVTAMVDNGTSANDDLDQISFSYYDLDPDRGCDYILGSFQLLDLTKGQVKVW